MSDEKQPGPKPDQLKIKGDWKDAVQKSLGKERPKDGWPDPEAEHTEMDDESDKDD